MCSSDNFGQIVNCEPIANLSNAVSQPVFIKKQLLDFVKRLRKVSKLNVNGYSLDEIFKSDLGLAVALDHHINRPGNVMSHIQSAITNLHQQHNDISTEISLWGSHHANNEAQLLDVYGNNRTDMTDGQKRFENLKQEFTV